MDQPVAHQPVGWHRESGQRTGLRVGVCNVSRSGGRSFPSAGAGAGAAPTAGCHKEEQDSGGEACANGNSRPMPPRMAGAPRCSKRRPEPLTIKRARPWSLRLEHTTSAALMNGSRSMQRCRTVLQTWLPQRVVRGRCHRCFEKNYRRPRCLLLGRVRRQVLDDPS